MNTLQPLIQFNQVHKEYRSQKQILTAVHAASFSIFPGETLGLVGESGCGKSTIGKCLLRLEKVSSGEILYAGKNICQLDKKQLFEYRHHVQIIFQDPYASLNPRMTVESIISEPLHIHKIAKGEQAQKIVMNLLNLVGLSQTTRHRFPHEFSGGQRQRIGIARALALNPQFIVCDEPISALDVSVQAQIINLLKTLQEEMGLTYLFIAHNLALVKYISKRVAVMYLGHIVEIAPSDALYTTPQHPYTQALLSAIPIPDPLIEKKRPRPQIKGEPTHSLKEITGCPFAQRCPHTQSICLQSKPLLKEIAPQHFAACHFTNLYTNNEVRNCARIK